MKSIMTILLSSLLLGSSAFAQISVPQVEGITVDGDLSDWGEAEGIVADSTMVADVTEVDDDADLSLVAYAGYDDSNMYVGVEVQDEELIFERSGDDIANNDAVEFWLNANQYGVALVEGNPVLHQWNFSGTPTELADAQVAFEYTDTGYVVEVAMPLSVVAEALGEEPAPGVSFPFAVGADDSDISGEDRQGQIYFPDTWTWSQTDTYATATLAD